MPNKRGSANDKRSGCLRRLITLAVLSSSPAQAQADADALEELRACGDIASDSERLECLDAALGRDAVPVAAAPGAPPAAADPPTASPTAGEAPAGATPAAPAPSAPAATTSAEPPAELSERASARDRRATARADRERRRDAADDAPRTVTIVAITRTALGATRFSVADGTTWVRTSGTEGRFPDAPFDAVLQPAMGDSFFLVSPLGGPHTRVSRAD